MLILIEINFVKFLQTVRLVVTKMSQQSSVVSLNIDDCATIILETLNRSFDSGAKDAVHYFDTSFCVKNFNLNQRSNVCGALGDYFKLNITIEYSNVSL